jgi:hypothetical protein
MPVQDYVYLIMAQIHILIFYNTLYFRTGSSGSNIWPLTILSTNCIGINNTAPTHNLDINGTAYLNGALIQGSDSNLKENIKNLTDPLHSLLLLQGVTYKLKIPDTKAASKLNSAVTTMADSAKNKNLTDTIDKNPPLMAIDTALYNRNHIGLIAQDVRKIFPQLVYEDKNGILSIDYISLIPVLIEALKQQQTQIDYLKQKIDFKPGNLKSAQIEHTSTGAEITNNSDQSALFQNAPNPFNSSTKISYLIASNAQNAYLYLFDMNGTQLKSFPIETKGAGNIIISASELKAGMYLYTLIVDSKEIDTKRMILTD